MDWLSFRSPALCCWIFCFTTSICLHPFAAFALSAVAITILVRWQAPKPGIVAVLLASLIRGFIFEGDTSSLSRVLYELVFLTFAIVVTGKE